MQKCVLNGHFLIILNTYPLYFGVICQYSLKIHCYNLKKGESMKKLLITILLFFSTTVLSEEATNAKNQQLKKEGFNYIMSKIYRDKITKAIKIKPIAYLWD